MMNVRIGTTTRENIILHKQRLNTKRLVVFFNLRTLQIKVMTIMFAVIAAKQDINNTTLSATWVSICPRVVMLAVIIETEKKIYDISPKKFPKFVTLSF